MQIKLNFIVFLFFTFGILHSQENTDTLTTKIDSLYREDQFYITFTYNNLANKPPGLKQTRFSAGLSFGFLRDMPLNKPRTHSIATGIGFAYNKFNQNLRISPNEQPVYALVNNDFSYKKNQFSQFLIELPLEFRWRTSTYQNHKFWRFYGGIKGSYLLHNKSIYTGNQGNVKAIKNKDFNQFLYGVYLSSGYDVFNLYLYYGLNSLFKEGKIDNEPLKLKTLSIGIAFYIL